MSLNDIAIQIEEESRKMRQAVKSISILLANLEKLNKKIRKELEIK